MRLAELTSALDENEIWGSIDVEISEIVFDSRQAGPNTLFVAIPGTKLDGHSFAHDALARGARALVVERRLDLPDHITQVVVPNTRRALALVSAAFYGFPGRKLRVIGVTGTDGKTTTSTLIGSILEAAGHRAGIVTTVAAKIGDNFIDTGFHTTTPDAPDLQRYLADMVRCGAEYAVLETTSHGLAQYRTFGAEYDVAVVTNVTHEHFDYHGSYREYLAAKGKLFEQLSSSVRKAGVQKVSVTNVDDVSYSFLAQFPADVKLTYGIESLADVTARDISLDAKGTRFVASTPAGQFEVQSTLLGFFNVYNMLAAIAVGISQDVAASQIQAGIQAVKGIPGRMEMIDCGQDFSVIVDFAHTPRSLEQALRLVRSLTKRRVIVVFGCAGLRDREKRPMMGEIAGRLADITVLTAEDPRTESVEAIIDEIAAGVERSQRRLGKDYFRVSDRGDAIRFAIEIAQSGDVVMITGKGHERSMCFGETEYPWSDQEAARKALGCKECL